MVRLSWVHSRSTINQNTTFNRLLMVSFLAVVTCLTVVVRNGQRDTGKHSHGFDLYGLEFPGIDTQEIQDARRNLSGRHGGAIHTWRKRRHDHQ